MKNINIIALLLVISMDRMYAQSQASSSFVRENYIYAITIKHLDDAKGKATLLTGIKVSGYDGIFTAMHGFLPNINNESGVVMGHIEATRFVLKNGQFEVDEIIKDLTVKKISKAQDIVLLDQIGGLTKKRFLSRDDGFVIENFGNISVGQAFEICGFPETKFPQSKQIFTAGPPTMRLGLMLHGPIRYNDKKRNLQNDFLDQNAIHLAPGSIFPAHSGAPIILEGRRIIGVANGGLSNSEHTVVLTWGIIWPKKLKVQDSNKVPKTEYPKEQYASLTQIEDDRDLEMYNLFAFPKVSPKWIFGLTFSKSFIIQPGKLNISNNWRDLSGYANFFIERKIAPWLMAGGYVSSNFAQFELVNATVSSERILQNTPEVTLRDNHILWGVQTSLLLARTPLYQFYIGAGAGRNIGVESTKFIQNHRSYIGIRHYLFHQQYLSMDFKGMYLHQFDTVPVRTAFGNRNYNNLKQLQLCLGINFAFGSPK